jgi:hypothetical protein
MLAVYTYQLMMLFLLGIKGFPFAVLIIPAPLLTGIYHWSSKQLFLRPWSLQALRAAADIDRLDEQVGAWAVSGGLTLHCTGWSMTLWRVCAMFRALCVMSPRLFTRTMC